MWLITNVKSNKLFFIKRDKTSIGRVGSDIVLEGDASISRVHAHLIVSGDELVLQDAASKYGTFLNTSRAVANQATKLKDGDTICFGKLSNNWIVQHVVQKTATSMLAQETREKILKIIANLRVEIADNFDSTCSHLTMNPQTMVSIKLLHALALCKPIVTPAYWISYKKSIENDQPLPKCADFVPQIKEDLLVSSNKFSLAPNDDRKKLFAGKTFLFVSNSQMNEFKDVIRSAGGKATSLTQVQVTIKECCAKNSIVIQPKASDTQTQNASKALKIKAVLDEKKRRTILDNEIGLALMHCSIDQWCNPDFTNESLLPGNKAAQLTIAKTSKAIIVEGTDSISFAVPAPSTSRARIRPKKVTGPVVVTIDLDSDDETDGVNKENISGSAETVESSEKTPTQSPISIRSTPDAQSDDISVSSINVSLPQTQTSIAETKHSPVAANENRRSLRSGSQMTQAEKSFAPPGVTSTPMNATNLFNFTDISSSSEINQRKRKNSENLEPPVVANKKSKKPDSTAKKTVQPKQSIQKKKATNDGSRDEEPQHKTSTRKRTAEAALGNVGGLFAFNTNFIKRNKPCSDESLESHESQPVVEWTEGSGIIPLIKKTPPLIATPVHKDVPDDSCDSGIWLSKKMTSFNLGNPSDDIKVEAQEPIDINTMDCTEDIKPQLLATLFDVLETTAHNESTSSIIFKRKSFVKKQNFRPQSSVVTTKLLFVEDTHDLTRKA